MDTAIAATVNPFAGLHAVTASPEEREAVRRATETALGEAPYYLERFGERGRLFGGSDGGWLVTVCAGDLPYIERQVLWLGRVLSPRGVPRYLLQRYLRILHDEVARSYLRGSVAPCDASFEDRQKSCSSAQDTVDQEAKDVACVREGGFGVRAAGAVRAAAARRPAL